MIWLHQHSFYVENYGDSWFNIMNTVAAICLPFSLTITTPVLFCCQWVLTSGTYFPCKSKVEGEFVNSGHTGCVCNLPVKEESILFFPLSLFLGKLNQSFILILVCLFLFLVGSVQVPARDCSVSCKTDMNRMSKIQRLWLRTCGQSHRWLPWDYLFVLFVIQGLKLIYLVFA